MLLLLLMMTIFVAHGSIDWNAQCTEGDYRQKMDRKKLLGRHRKVLVHSESSRCWKGKVSQRIGEF